MREREGESENEVLMAADMNQIEHISHPALSPNCDVQYKLNIVRKWLPSLQEIVSPVKWTFFPPEKGTGSEVCGEFAGFPVSTSNEE